MCNSEQRRIIIMATAKKTPAPAKKAVKTVAAPAAAKKAAPVAKKAAAPAAKKAAAPAAVGIKPIKAKEVYRVGRVADVDAELIQLAANTPAFEVERIAYDSRAPFEYTLSTMRADRYEIRSTLYI